MITETDYIFVFGSNYGGRHGRGSALYAKRRFGAKTGDGTGRTGNAYGIPTKDERFKVLSLATIQRHINEFLVYAMEHPELKFRIVKIGCGLAGYKPWQISPMFRGAPENCILPKGWRSNV